MTASMSTASCRHDIIPRPRYFKRQPGYFTLNQNTEIVADKVSEGTAKYLSDCLAPAMGFRLPVRTNKNTRNSNVIILGILPGRKELGGEGYELSARPQSVRIAAGEPAGLFYACQTLRQMLPAEIISPARAESPPWRLPCSEIRDFPRFPWRGLMLDTSRYFHPKDFILRYIDLMAFYKMNRLHLHLNDTQSWTLEIKKYPRLTDPATRWPPGEKERGSYSRSDMREIVKYAAARQVMVIPEFDLPGHARAILNAYPELICSHIPRPAGSHDYGEMCAGKEEVYDFIGNVLDEITAVFDSPYIHIGGDEYGGWDWEKCPDCQRRITTENLEAEDTPELRKLFKNCQSSPRKYLLYRYMMRRVARMVTDRKRIPVLWDDLAWRGKFPEKSIIMQWHCRGAYDWMQNADTPENPAREAAEAGRAAVVAPHSHYYFDYLHGGALLKRLYEFDPVPRGLAANRHSFILGPHACSWERRPADVDWKVFPRLLILAEKGWAAKSLSCWDDFRQRLEKHLPRLQRLGVRCAKPLAWPRKELFFQWKAPAGAGWQTSWLINEIIAGNGEFKAEVSITRVKGEKIAAGLELAVDGHEFAPCQAAGNHEHKRAKYLFRFRIKEYKPESLYRLRLSLHGNEKSPLCGKVLVRKSNKQNA